MAQFQLTRNYSFLFFFFFLIFIIVAVEFFTPLTSNDVFFSNDELFYSRLSFSPRDRILIMSPHPDDAALVAGGVIQRAKESGSQIKVVYITCGEHNTDVFLKEDKFPLPNPVSAILLGNKRHEEAERAMKDLGLKRDQIIFLGFPDFGTLKIWVDCFSPPPYVSGLTLHDSSFYTFVYKKGISFSAQNELNLLKEIISQFKPTKIFYPVLSDLNPDHRATGLFTQAALFDLRNKIHPQEYQYFVHAKDWPVPHQFAPFSYLFPPSRVKNLSPNWSLVYLTEEEESKKSKAISEHKSQVKVKPCFMKSFVRKNELFLDGQDNHSGEQLPLWNREEMQRNQIVPVIKSVVVQNNQDYIYFNITLYKEIKRFLQMNLFVYPLQENKPFSQSPKYKIIITKGKGETVKIRFQNRYGKVFLEKQGKIIRKGQFLMIRVDINKRYLPETENIFAVIETELAHLRVSETPWWNIHL